MRSGLPTSPSASPAVISSASICNAWFALSIEIGLLLLTTHAAIPLLLLLIGFALATKRGRATLRSFDPLFGAMVSAVLVLPYLVWMVRAGAVTLPQLPAVDALGDRLLSWGILFGGLLLLFALALLERDGALMLIAWIGGIVAVVVLGVLSGTLLQAITPWIDRLI